MSQNIVNFGYFFSLIFLAGSLPLTAQSEQGGNSGGDGGVQASESYVITELDYLRMRIIGEESVASEVRVSGDGTVSFPYIGTVRVAGNTVQQARQKIFDLYNADYFVEPQIELTVISYRQRRVLVQGMVNRQGFVVFPPEEKMTLLGAIALAGGWSQNRLADPSRVTLTRILEDNTKEEKQYDATKLTSQDVPLQDGDTITVPERRF